MRTGEAEDVDEGAPQVDVISGPPAALATAFLPMATWVPDGDEDEVEPEDFVEPGPSCPERAVEFFS